MPIIPEMNKIYQGDCVEIMRSWPDGFVNCCVTSPPYWGLRDYGVDGQLGWEKTPQEFIAKMVFVFREVKRVLCDDGTLWINIGDSYSNKNTPGIKPKDMVGVPWMLAFALRDDGWYLRSDIIWSKPNPMPESVTDRPTKAHEYLFLLSKSKAYFYDAEAIKDKAAFDPGPMVIPDGWKKDNGAHDTIEHSKRTRVFFKDAQTFNGKNGRPDKQRGHSRRHSGFNDQWDLMSRKEQISFARNKRTVWTIATEPFAESHFATFPTRLIEPCIMAGTMGGGVVLDPFMGAGTTALVAARLNRKFIGTELNPKYIQMAEKRIAAELAQGKLF